MLQQVDMTSPQADKPARRRKGEPGERRCIATRESGPRAGLLRLVVSPEGQIVPDLAEQLPGRGFWITASKAAFDLALKKNLFARAAGGPVSVPGDLAACIGRQLAARACALLGFARRAGQLVQGRDRVRAAMANGTLAVVISARDVEALRAAPGGAARHFTGPTASEIGAALGRDAVGHVGIAPGRLAENLALTLARLAGFNEPAAGRDGATGASQSMTGKSTTNG